ncbi:B12-binding domain-containing radical SAM protein [Elusimicrobiota bacterium]
MKIALVNPPSPFLIDERVFLPLGILYIASVLREKGHDVRFYDLARMRDWEQVVGSIRAEALCVTGTTPHFPYLAGIARIGKKNIRRMIAGGPHATIDPQSLVDVGYDSVVVHEGEDVIEEALFTNDSVVQGTIVENLETLPLPARDLVDVESYNFVIEGRRAIHAVFTRGCPFSCGFCCNVARRVKFRNVDSCIAELADITSKFGIDRFMFFDDTFTLNRRWLTEFCGKIATLNVKWRCFVRANAVNLESLKMMKEAGCSELGVGVESGSQQILDIMNKKTRVDDNTRCRELCRKVGILFKAFIIIGCPGETLETFQKTRSWLLKNRPDKYSIFVFTPYPGTPFFKDKAKFDYQLTEEYDYGRLWWGGIMADQISVSRTTALSAERICALRNDLLREMKEKGLDDQNNIL